MNMETLVREFVINYRILFVALFISCAVWAIARIGLWWIARRERKTAWLVTLAALNAKTPDEKEVKSGLHCSRCGRCMSITGTESRHIVGKDIFYYTWKCVCGHTFAYDVVKPVEDGGDWGDTWSLRGIDR